MCTSVSGRKREKEHSGGFGKRAYKANTHVYMCILGGGGVSFFFMEPWKMRRGK